ncbi:MAG: hypothetical protein M3Q42_13965 [Pseudomonadota bacterium]|nr:hypothetical protein [Pseudomonadota bacterium]
MTPTNAFSWPGWTPQKTLILPIPPDLWPPPSSTIALDGITFQPKHELHVTLVGRGLGQALHGEPGRRGFRVQAVREAFGRQNWDFERSGQFLRLEKRELAGRGRGRSIGSIVEHVRMPALARFYDELADLLGRKLAIPPPHVTLYTVGRSQGIAVPDVATLQRLAVREVKAGELPAEAVEPSRAWQGR